MFIYLLIKLLVLMRIRLCLGFIFNAISLYIVIDFNTGKKQVLMKQYSLPHVAGCVHHISNIQFCTFLIS